MVVCVLGLFVAWLYRRYYRVIWARRVARAILLLLPALTAIAAGARFVFQGKRFPSLEWGEGYRATSALGTTLAIVTLALLLAAPVGLALGAVAGWLRFSRGDRAAEADEVTVPADPEPSLKPEIGSMPEGESARANHPGSASRGAREPSLHTATTTRRAFVEQASLAVPAIAVGLTAAGTSNGFLGPRTALRPVSLPVPKALEGLRILQITDLHLGAFFGRESIDDLVSEVSAAKPDLVVLTGDLCDYVPWLRDCLRALIEVPSRHGFAAVFGNHEHMRGPRQQRRIYDDVGIPLLFDAHRTVKVGDHEVVIVGLDDPNGHYDDRPWIAHLDAALDGSPSAPALRLGLSHRPKGFELMAERGVELTLSGHTHGGQLGLGDRSLMQGLAENAYLRGFYKKGGSQLYTSSGAGHWAAFRIACPTELALLEVTSSRVLADV